METVTELYQQSVERYAGEQKNYRFTCTGTEHINIVFRELLKSAKDIVRIHSLKILAQLDEQSIKRLRDLSSMGVKIRIMLPEKKDVGHKVASILASLWPENLQMRSFTGELFDQLGHLTVDGFMTVDSHAFFLDNVVNFNEADISVTLSQKFDYTFNGNRTW